jgi:Flp pilus assembly protein TadD
MAQSKYADAAAVYQQSLDIARQLTNADPTNEEWQSDLATICEKTGEALATLAKPAEALQEFRESFTIFEKLAKSDPKNSERATAEALALFRIGITLPRTGTSSADEIRTALTKARDIMVELKQRVNELDTQNQSQLDRIEAALNSL